ncbi:MAG: aminopeptidase [Raoultibacter sp.]
MPEILDDITYLSRDIGPRPAGTEEEQQAALYITEQFQKGAGLSAVIEDFKCTGSAELVPAVCYGVTFVTTIVSFFVAAFVLPAIILTAVSAVLYVLELIDKPVLSRVFSRGISQNVIAKYEPGNSSAAKGARRRKIVVLAHYDSGKALPELIPPILSVLPIINRVVVGALIALPLLLAIRYVFFLHAVGGVAIFFNVLTIIALVFVALPLIVTVLHKFAAYNEAANCNASGVAVMLEVARRVGNGRVSEAELARRAEESATVHGENEARAAGLVPDGAELVYRAPQMKTPEPQPQTEAERLAMAKAAIAALTGQPVRDQPSDIYSHLVQVKEQPLAAPTDDLLHEQIGQTREVFTGVQPPAPAVPVQVAESVAVPEQQQPVQPVYTPSASAAKVPDWYKKAQTNAKKEGVEPPVQRSRYAAVLDHFASDQTASGDTQAMPPLTPESISAPVNYQAPAKVVEPAPVDQAPALAAEPASVPVRQEPAPAPARQEPAPAAPDATTAMQPINVEALRRAAQPASEPVSAPTPAATPLTPAPEPAPAPAPVVETPVSRSISFTEEIPAFEADFDPQPNIPGMGQAAKTGFDFVPAPELAADQAIDENAAPQPDSSFLIEQQQQREAVVPKASRRPIVLPDVTTSSASLPSIAEVSKQRAPLAEAEASGKTAAKSLLSTMIPEVSSEPAAADQKAASTPKINPVDLPSLSGVLKAQAAEESASEAEPTAVSATGSFMPVGATGAFAPVSDALVADVAPEDLYIDDADDSSFVGNVTETGAFAGPGYVDMPKSRIHKFFDKFSLGKKKKEDEISPQEWLEVEDDFDARRAGAERGGWDSFQQNDADFAAQPVFPESFQQGTHDGAGSLPANSPQARKNRVGGIFNRSAEEDSFDAGRPYADAFDDDDDEKSWQGGAFSRGRAQQVEEDEFDPTTDGALSEDMHRSRAEEEFKQIYQFKHPDIDTEVWFVSVGSELTGNAGMYAFLKEHAQELKGAIFINLEGLGAGDLCFIEKEGSLKKYSASSRMKRYIKKASQASGVAIDTARIGWKESSASVVLKHGAQAMSLVGMDGAKPAFFGQGDDVLENLDEELLQKNADFVMEMLKNI